MSLSHSLHQFALLVRLPNSFTVISNVVAAVTLASHGDLPWAILAVAILASLCLYHGGMVLNDCLDIDEDRRTQPQRPLVSGAFSLKAGWSIAVLLLALGPLLYLSLGIAAFVVSLLLCGFILAYNLCPRDGLFGCILMGGCRALNYLVVLAALAGVTAYAHFAVIVGIYVMSLTLLSRDENYAERPYLLWLSAAAMMLGAGLFLLLLDSAGLYYWLSVITVCCGLSFLLYRIVTLSQNYTPERIQAQVMMMIIGMIPLDASLLFIAGYPVIALAVLCLMVPGKFLARKLYVT